MGKAAIILKKGSPNKASRHKAHFFADNKQNTHTKKKKKKTEQC